MPDVIVIGGGFAGLSAATALAESGAARPRLRGPAQPRRARDGVSRPADRRAHRQRPARAGRLLRRDAHVPPPHRGSDKLHRPSTLRVPMIDERGRRSALALPPLPAPLASDWRRARVGALSLGERLSVLRLGLRPSRPRRGSTDDDGSPVARAARPAARLCADVLGAAGAGGAESVDR